MAKVSVLGAGAWGTTLAQVLVDAGQEVLVWGRNESVVNEINTSHTNTKFLPEVKLPKEIKATTYIEQAFDFGSSIVLAIPAQSLRENLLKWRNHFPTDRPIISTLKGIEANTFKRMIEIVQEVLGTDPAKIGLITGPNLAGELSLRQPAGAVAASPSEEADRARNQTYRQNLVNKQSEFPTLKRNLDEVIKVATDLDPSSIWSAGTLGALNRKFKDITGDPTYKQLSKDLANVAISNIQAVGGSMDTVAGQQLTRMANGDETYPPAVLLNIARRTYADLTNVNMQAEAAQKFASKFGDNNLNAFRQEWNKNADSKVFEAISIYQNVQDPAERKKLIDGLLGSNQQTRKEFAEKYKNIKKLTETGEL